MRDNTHRQREDIERREGVISAKEAEVDQEKRRASQERDTNVCIAEIHGQHNQKRREKLQIWEQRLNEKWRQIW